MSEIELLYKNAGVGYLMYVVATFPPVEYPQIDFTAEKQLELIKLLQRKNGYKFSFSSTNDNSEYLFFAHKDNTPVQELIVAGDKCYEDALAELINSLWQDLTEQERIEIADILKG